MSKYFNCLVLLLWPLASWSLEQLPRAYHGSPKLAGPARLLQRQHDPTDVVLNQLDNALQQISSVYTQALFAGTHTPELEADMQLLEMELFELLDQLYKQNRLSDYMKYEAEVTRQLIIYNMLKKLFGYAHEQLEGDDV